MWEAVPWSCYMVYNTPIFPGWQPLYIGTEAAGRIGKKEGGLSPAFSAPRTRRRRTRPGANTGAWDGVPGTIASGSISPD
jgi:hypothetical protein